MCNSPPWKCAQRGGNDGNVIGCLVQLGSGVVAAYYVVMCVRMLKLTDLYIVFDLMRVSENMVLFPETKGFNFLEMDASRKGL